MLKGVSPTIGGYTGGKFGRSINRSNSLRVSWSFVDGSLPSGVTFTRSQAVAGSTTAFGSGGVLQYYNADQPRFDYDPVTLSALGLLLEVSRTNSHPRSVALNSWSNIILSTVSANVVTSPDGALTGDTNTTSTGGNARVQQIVTLASGTLVTWSAFLKAGTINRGALQFHNGGGAAVAGTIFNLTGSGSITNNTGGATSTIKSVGGGWYYCTTTFTTGATNGFFLAGPASNASGFLASSPGNSVSVWGVQMEVGGTASSFILTDGPAVTRAADQLSFTIPSGVTRLRYVFDDNSTQDVAVTAGAYVVDPATLNRPRVKYIQLWRV